MKIIKPILITLSAVACLISEAVFAQDTTIAIKTSAECENCKKRIESNIRFEKGVKNALLDVETKILRITYDRKKNSPEKLRESVSKIGYDADDILADAKAYKKLPKCCQKGGMKKE